MVNKAFVEGNWVVHFRRGLVGDLIVQWQELYEKHQGSELTSGDDVVVWALEKGGVYSTRYLYKFLSWGGVISSRMKELWGAKLPLKVRIFFLWQVFNERLQSIEQLKKRE
jgi:hypothetical protein